MIDYDDIKEIEIEFTTFCNAQCPLCYRNYKSFYASPYSKPYSRSIDDAISQLDKFKNLEFVMLVGSMSEPTLYSHFVDIVDYLKNRSIQLEICTNGDTHEPNWWRNLGYHLKLDDKVYFTICGSTQEIHETYRKHTKLSNIIDNAKALRSVIPIDYAQCIRFNYNSNDFDSSAFKTIANQFSTVYMTETFYQKEQDNYEYAFDAKLFMPCKAKQAEYDKLKDFVDRRNYNILKTNTDCLMTRTNRIQIDVFGNIYPCYLFLEHMNGIKWNEDMDDIKHVNHNCCRFCDKIVQMFAKKHDLEYII